MEKEKNRSAILINSFPHKCCSIQILEMVVKKTKTTQQYTNGTYTDCLKGIIILSNYKLKMRDFRMNASFYNFS